MRSTTSRGGPHSVEWLAIRDTAEILASVASVGPMTDFFGVRKLTNTTSRDRHAARSIAQDIWLTMDLVQRQSISDTGWVSYRRKTYLSASPY